MQRPLGYVSAQDVLKLSAKDREELLARAAAQAEQEYMDNKGLTDFEAYGEEDLCDDTPPSDD